MTTSVHIVIGSTGKYSDHREWDVAAYTNETEAKRHAEILNGLVFDSESWPWQQKYTFSTVYDPCLSIDYNGASYDVITLPLSRSVEEFLATSAAKDSRLVAEPQPVEARDA